MIFFSSFLISSLLPFFLQEQPSASNTRTCKVIPVRLKNMAHHPSKTLQVIRKSASYTLKDAYLPFLCEPIFPAHILTVSHQLGPFV